MGRSQRDKGHRWERAVATMLREHGIPAKRGWQTAQGGIDAPDVDAPPFWVECKVGQHVKIRPAFERLLSECPDGRIPILVVKDDRRKPYAVVPLDAFLDLATAKEKP